MMLRLRLIVPLLVAVMTLPLFAGDGQADNFAAQDVKVAFIYNFAKFISWPKPATTKSIVIGILGTDPFGPALKSIKGKTVCNRTLEIRPVLTVKEAQQCDLLFIAQSEKNRLQHWLNILGQLPILTISDLPGFIEQGGMLELTEIDQRIRFAVNLDTIHAASLNLDAQLLNLAYQVLHQQGND
jgi:YfiR/HmsC-like